MSQHGTQPASRRDRLLVNGLWVAAAAFLIAGFILRSLSSFAGRADIRIGGVVLIAIGSVVAVVAWIGERVTARRLS